MFPSSSWGVAPGWDDPIPASFGNDLETTWKTLEKNWKQSGNDLEMNWISKWFPFHGPMV